MNQWIKRGLWTVAAVAGLAGAALYAAQHLSDRKMNRQIKVTVQPVAYRDDAQSVERGRYLYNSRGCSECHGANGASNVFVDDPKSGMKLRGPNITRGPGGVVGAYQPEDWVRAIRHGVKPNGRPALVMPSEDYNRLTDADLASLVAYVRQLPPVAGEGALLRMPTMVRALYAVGVIPDAAETIDHTLPPSQPVAERVSVEHGKYVSGMCIGCHGANFSGGKIPGGPPAWPAAANLTPGVGSGMARYDGRSIRRDDAHRQAARRVRGEPGDAICRAEGTERYRPEGNAFVPEESAAEGGGRSLSASCESSLVRKP